MRPSLRSALWMLIAANLLGGGAIALAQTPAAPAPAAAPAGSAAPSAGPAQTPTSALGKRSLIGARCKDDAAKLCPNVGAGAGRLGLCLRAHEAELSEACKAALPPGRAGSKAAAAPAPQAGATPAGAAPGAPSAAAPAHGTHGAMAGKEWGPMKGMHRACAADVEKHCKDVTPGHGRIALCLNAHTSELSATCKPVAQDIAAKMNEPMPMHADCAADAQKLCGDVPPGSGRAGFCLGEHAAELSPACKKHMDEMKSHWRKGGKMGGMGNMGMMGGMGGMGGGTMGGMHGGKMGGRHSGKMGGMQHGGAGGAPAAPTPAPPTP